MKQPNLPTRVTVGLALVLGLLLSPIQPTVVHAQSTDAKNGLEISPVLVELNGEPGKSYTIDIKVRNVTQSNLYFSTSVDDFGAKDETGTPSILLEEGGEPLATSMKTWVDTIPSFNLRAGVDRAVPATVRIPNNAEPGGHYGVVRFSGHENASDEGNVGLVASAGTLVLVRVAGDINESLELTSFEATKDSKAGIAFESGPITFISRFTNTGSVHVKPIGQIEIKDGLGNSVAVLPINEAKGNVLPDSTRRFESTLNQAWLFGKYTADISIAYGTSGQAIVRTIEFWVIPWKLVFVVLLVVVTLAYVLRTLIGRYNSYIIRKDRARTGRKKPNKRS